MIKKIITLLFITLIVSTNISLTSAQNTRSAEAQPEIEGGQSVTGGELFRRYNYEPLNSEDNTDNTKLSAVNRLPQTSWQATLRSIVTTLLNITGGLTLIAFTIGGIMMIVGSHNQEQLEKGKKIFIYSLIGLIVIAASYAIVIGVAELQFFTAS
ncbi:hypothetical protein GF376_02080 [Candidatus Peregrinibacteria bacterium]|nr:hypothetical protein [Candidatus Peregrinibacteria bacterium]